MGIELESRNEAGALPFDEKRDLVLKGCGGWRRLGRTGQTSRRGEGNLERVSEWKPYNWVTTALALSLSRPSAPISCGIHVD